MGRKVSGFQRPARHNAEAFERAVQAVASATQATPAIADQCLGRSF
ncbi:MAG TPA: DUF2277 family protein [Streptosporangiaceae bacterium]|nr:DUF2277 family protein [Streptosporangiaceae bacterium]